MSNDFNIDNSKINDDTGKYLIFYDRNELEKTSDTAKNKLGIDLPTTMEEAEAVIASDERHSQDSVVMPLLGVAVTNATQEQIDRLEVGGDSPIVNIRKEYVFKIAGQSDFSDNINVSTDYLLGYRAGVDSLVLTLLECKSDRVEVEVQSETSFRDLDDFTWGLQATGVNQSGFTGEGIKVAILDTGFDMTHPDFVERQIISKSFVEGIANAQDDNGHGTHCLGTIAGPRNPVAGRRYGIAFNAQLFVGKVMKANGLGNESDILHGINWALQNGCRIISLSFGKPVSINAVPDQQYEEIGAIALEHNCLIIAAAGNDSQRPGNVLPVELPANSKTIMAVGAIDRRLAIYPNSNAGINGNGGGIDIVGPGVNVYSSKPIPPSPHYGLNSGTSMATPHVSGIAALLMEANPAATAEQIWTKLTQTAQRLPLSNIDVGGGLVQSP